MERLPSFHSYAGMEPPLTRKRPRGTPTGKTPLRVSKIFFKVQYSYNVHVMKVKNSTVQNAMVSQIC